MTLRYTVLGGSVIMRCGVNGHATNQPSTSLPVASDRTPVMCEMYSGGKNRDRKLMAGTGKTLPNNGNFRLTSRLGSSG